ncbi:MAG: phosphatase PAP2 family protein [Actinomycetia bacterium]|nr:phosphatase PAP2 family protein [Actinomycetes bacterium]MCH9734495.1 phosphatase PAP2 family protein [Actinomycetes bacterium]
MSGKHPTQPQTVASLLAGLRPGNDANPNTADRAVLRELDELDKGIYAAVAESHTPLLDEPIRRLSNSANFSKLWMAAAAGLAGAGGARGRRAAVTGLAAIGVTSAVVNQGFKRLYPRVRPDRDGREVPEARHVKMPESTSFPSGHSASGFAFATAVSSQLPVVGVPLYFLAGAVAYSRVHTGVHYPGDVVIGSLVGAGIGGIVASVARRLN